jgi:hypothetical protein
VVPPSPRAWPASAWRAAFRDIERTLILTEGFSLVPIEVAQPEIAHDLAAWFRERGHRVAWVEPRSEHAWRTLADTLLALDASSTDRVMVLGDDDDADGMVQGLQRVNLARDPLRAHLVQPLLWCGSRSFHEATWTHAPDFWSIREMVTRLLTPLSELTETRSGQVWDAFNREKQRALEDLWAIVLRDHVRALESLGAYLRLIFAIGFASAGAAWRGRALMQPLDAEEATYAAPNRVLFGLYRARFEHVVARGSGEAWRSEVQRLLDAVHEPRVKDRVEWLRTRTDWLRTRQSSGWRDALKPWLEKALAEFEASPDREGAEAVVVAALEHNETYAFEMWATITRVFEVLLREGDDDAVRSVLPLIVARLSKINLSGHRAGVIGACIRAAASIHDRAMLGLLCDELCALATVPLDEKRSPQTRDLLSAVHPMFDALRAMPDLPGAASLLIALEPRAIAHTREEIKLRAALAEGYILLGDRPRAEALLAACDDDLFAITLDRVGRYDGCVATLRALQSFPMASRVRHGAFIAERLDRFTDTFSASVQKIYETHKILVAERLVDCVLALTDEERALLDEERTRRSDELVAPPV